MELQTNTTTQHLTPMPAIRAKCLDCGGQSAIEVRLCPVSRCPLWPYRFGKSPDFTTYQGRNLNDKTVTMRVVSTGFQAIKTKCKDCGGPDGCADGYSRCPLYQCLEGRKRRPRRVLSEEARQRCVARMEAINAKRASQAR